MDQPEDTAGYLRHPARDATTTRDDLCSEETAAERIDKALETLKAELVAMRQQDVQLLKQLLHINQNIRRLKHVRRNKSGLGDSSRGARAGQFTAHAQTDVLARAKIGHWKLPCQQQHLNACVTALRSPQVTSTSSIDAISNEEEVDSLYGSATDLDLRVTSPCASPDANKTTARSPATITSLTFTHAELSGGDFSYAELLKRNVRLWKWSVGQEREYLAWGQLSCAL